jgi:hypothetical protein
MNILTSALLKLDDSAELNTILCCERYSCDVTDAILIPLPYDE